MEMLNGPSLKRELSERGAFEPLAAAHIVTCLANALQLAHDQGVVHRDLKPANVVSHRFDSGERIYKLIDFGLANIRQASDATALTWSASSSAPSATRRPEQLRGEAVTLRADIYSLGAMVFEMLTGRAPFETADPFSLVTQHLTVPPPRPIERAAGLARPRGRGRRAGAGQGPGGPLGQRQRVRTRARRSSDRVADHHRRHCPCAAGQRVRGEVPG